MGTEFNIRAEREYYAELPKVFSITDSTIIENMMRLCTNNNEWPSLLSGKTVLEVGAGECGYLSHFLKMASPEVYIASDIFPERMLLAKKLGKYPKVEYLGANTLNLPLKDGSIDLCLAFGVLHHIPNLDEGLAEIARVLKVGGSFIFRDPWAGNPLLWCRYKFGRRSENEFPLTRKRIVQGLAKHGFRLENLRFFWLRFPWLPPGPWSVNITGLALR
jgi:ubiquinone/menaquinone biosynthesis C-methylase UbiE